MGLNGKVIVRHDVTHPDNSGITMVGFFFDLALMVGGPYPVSVDDR